MTVTSAREAEAHVHVRPAAPGDAIRTIGAQDRLVVHRVGIDPSLDAAGDDTAGVIAERVRAERHEPRDVLVGIAVEVEGHAEELCRVVVAGSLLEVVGRAALGAADDCAGGDDGIDERGVCVLAL